VFEEAMVRKMLSNQFEADRWGAGGAIWGGGNLENPFIHSLLPKKRMAARAAGPSSSFLFWLVLD
jgi:hypothetical protein